MNVDKMQEIKVKYEDGVWEGHDGYSPAEMYEDVEWLIKEIERLRTIEQAYNALRSAF